MPAEHRIIGGRTVQVDWTVREAVGHGSVMRAPTGSALTFETQAEAESLVRVMSAAAPHMVGRFKVVPVEKGTVR